MLKNFFKLFSFSLFFIGSAMAETYIIDVRTPEEFSQGHIDNALNIEFQNIMQGVTANNINTEDSILLYCRSGKRAGVALLTLSENGYKNVKNLGGLEDAKKILVEQK